MVRVPRHALPRREAEILQGTLDLLILKVLTLEPMHGYGIAQRLQQISRDALHIRQGSLYPALYRLEKRGLLSANWKTIGGREAKFYSLTNAGRQQLQAETSGWKQLCAAVQLVLEASK